MWLTNSQGYKRIFLFGFSAGGVVAAYEIQKDYATRFSAVVVSCAPVDWSWSSAAIYHSALSAYKTKAPICFSEPVNDIVVIDTDYYHLHPQMQLYYNNTLVDKGWDNWNDSHSFFPYTSLDHPGENASTVVINWYNKAHPPSTPFTPSGPKNGFANTSYSYSTGTYDANLDNVKYEFKWGDGTYRDTTFYPPGQNVTVSHAWTRTGTFNVSVRAQDAPGNWSRSASTLVTIVKPLCALKTLTDGWFYVPDKRYVTATALKVEMLFNYSKLVGDQTGGTSPYGKINYPDGIVDVTDIGFVQAKYGKQESRAGWDYMADVNPDRLIDITDLSIVVSNYGGHESRGHEYINGTGLSGVIVLFSTGDAKSPDSNGFVVIPPGASSFNVTLNGTYIGAMIIFCGP
jgi:hypothetical protein